jgi:hypothetical protein
MLGEERIDDASAYLAQPGQRASFILANEAAITDDIGGGGKPSLDATIAQSRAPARRRVWRAKRKWLPRALCLRVGSLESLG